MLREFGLLLIMTFCLSGCMTISSEPFGKFSSSTQELRDGADAALSINDVENRKLFIEETAKDSLTDQGAETVLNLMLENVEGDPFSWQMNDVPLFMASEHLREGLYTVNNTMVAYSELLKSLAASDLVSQEKFDEITKELNANLNSAAQSLNAEADQGIALFSTAAIKSAQLYIEKKRQKHLIRIINENQSNIESLAEIMHHSLRTAARNLTQNYHKQSNLLAQKLLPNSTESLASRKKQVEAIITLNEEYMGRLNVLKVLDRSYAALPNAHHELLVSIKRPDLSLSSMRELASAGKHLSKLYKELIAEPAN